MDSVFTPVVIAGITGATFGIVNALSDVASMPKIVKQLVGWGVAVALSLFAFYLPELFNTAIVVGLGIGLSATGGVGILNRAASKVGTAVDLTKAESK